MIDINIKLIDGAQIPKYKTDGSAGMDLHSTVKTTILPLQRVLVPTGLFIELPEGYEAQVRPRSGLALNHGITVLNSPGTIDSDFRGEIKVILINLSNDSYTINIGDSIAQMIFSSITTANLIEKDKLNNTIRGNGGFGSTGI